MRRSVAAQYLVGRLTGAAIYARIWLKASAALPWPYRTGVPLDLDLDIVSPGRKAKSLHAEVLRPLTGADLALLETERGIKPSAIQRISDRHHSLARLLSSGVSVQDACAITGYTESRVSILKGDPAFEELIEFYRQGKGETVQDLSDKLVAVARDAVSILQDRLELEPETMDAETLLSVAKFGADRSGHGPQSRTTNVNVNVNLADRLSAARKRVSSSPTEGAEEPPLFLELQANAQR